MQQIQKVSDAHYVLPKVGDARLDVHAFLSETLFTQTDEALWRQAAEAAAYPGMIGLYLPDTHLGYGIPVGVVAVTEEVIIQAGSGYDISCGVVYLRVPDLDASDVADWEKRQRWIDDVELRVATGEWIFMERLYILLYNAPLPVGGQHESDPAGGGRLLYRSRSAFDGPRTPEFRTTSGLGRDAYDALW